MTQTVMWQSLKRLRDWVQRRLILLELSVAGDYMQVSDNGVIDQSVNTSETHSTVTTSTVSDSYNEGSYNSTSTDTSTETQSNNHEYHPDIRWLSDVSFGLDSAVISRWC